MQNRWDTVVVDTAAQRQGDHQDIGGREASRVPKESCSCWGHHREQADIYRVWLVSCLECGIPAFLGALLCAWLSHIGSCLALWP